MTHPALGGTTGYENGLGMEHAGEAESEMRPTYSGAMEPEYECGPGRERGTTECALVARRGAREGISQFRSVLRSTAKEAEHGSGSWLLLRAGRAQGHGDGVCAMGGRQGEEAARGAELRDVYSGVARTRGLAAGVRSDARGDGVDRSLLEAGVARAGGTVRAPAGERAARESDPWAEDGPGRRRLAGGVAPARVSEG